MTTEPAANSDVEIDDPENAHRRTCRLCREPVAQLQGPGRPPEFCSREIVLPPRRKGGKPVVITCRKAWNWLETALHALGAVADTLGVEERSAMRREILRRLQETVRPDHRRPRGSGGRFLKKTNERERR